MAVVSALRLATRSSPLALWQANHVAELLRRAGEGAVELVPLESQGDRDRATPIEALAGRGVFVTEIEQAVLEGRAEVAVHSAKDLPSAAPPEGLVLAAVPERGPVEDALVGRRLEELGPGALIATGSVRRRVQLASFRPDLGFVGLRGNIGTRLEKVPPGGAAVVARAALERLGLSASVAEVLPFWLMLPQVGQGAIALRCAADDERTRARLAAIDHEPSHRALRAERAFLSRLGGGCDAPVGALAQCAGSRLRLEGLIASADGHAVVRRAVEGEDPEEIGARLADELGASGVLALALADPWP